MAKILVAGDAVIINSALPLEDLKMVKKYRPEALNLYSGKENENLEFSILVGCGSGVCPMGIGFDSETRDEAKLATLTVMLSEVTGDLKEYVADKFGCIMTNLNKIEATLPAVIEEIRAEKAAVMSGITIFGAAE